MNVTSSFSSSTNPYSIGSDALTIFVTFVQPWFTVLGVLENALIVLVLSLCLPSQRGGRSRSEATRRPRQASSSGAGGGLATVSRIYYIIIALCELSICLVGFLLRNSLRLLPSWVWKCEQRTYQ